jgi:hypothetical protein
LWLRTRSHEHVQARSPLPRAYCRRTRSRSPPTYALTQSVAVFFLRLGSSPFLMHALPQVRPALPLPCHTDAYSPRRSFSNASLRRRPWTPALAPTQILTVAAMDPWWPGPDLVAQVHTGAPPSTARWGLAEAMRPAWPPHTVACTGYPSPTPHSCPPPPPWLRSSTVRRTGVDQGMALLWPPPRLRH